MVRTYIVRLLTPILAAKVGIVRVLCRIAVFEPTEGCRRLSQVSGDERFESSKPSSNVPVPKFRHRYGSVPTTSHHFINSSVPNSFDSMPSQASSGLRIRSGQVTVKFPDGLEFHRHLLGSYLFGRCSFGPTPSCQWYVATKLPPGYLTTGTLMSFMASITSLRNPFSSERGFPGS